MNPSPLAKALTPILLMVSLSAATTAVARNKNQTQDPLPERIHCPLPKAISFTQIPSSIHGYYSAVSEDGTGWGALSLGFYDPEYLSFSSAEISEINGYWRIYCSYRDGGSFLNLSSGVESAYAACHFPDKTQNCEGTRDACVIECPGIEVKPEPKSEPKPESESESEPDPEPRPDQKPSSNEASTD